LPAKQQRIRAADGCHGVPKNTAVEFKKLIRAADSCYEPQAVAQAKHSSKNKKPLMPFKQFSEAACYGMLIRIFTVSVEWRTLKIVDLWKKSVSGRKFKIIRKSKQ
jgi:hypothetical protein